MIYGLSCSKDSPTRSLEKEASFVSYQIGGCNHNSLGKASFDDSCFVYSFDDTLKIDFCVVGNCCPDSNRFVADYKIKSDTLFVTVTDTSANLCHCNCNYTFHLEFSGLENDKYLFYCKYDELMEYKEQIAR